MSAFSPLPSVEFHGMVKRGDMEGVRRLLMSSDYHRFDINCYDRGGRTALMYAVESAAAGVDMVEMLLDHGAQIHLRAREPAVVQGDAFVLSLLSGDPAKVELLLKRGAQINYRYDAGYTALLYAVHGRDLLRDTRLISLLRLLVKKGVDLNAITVHRESALRVLSRICRFDAVQFLLDSGAQENQLAWTPLIRAVALGSLEDVQRLVESRSGLEDRDWWSRTAFLVAVQCGDIAKASMLIESGCDPTVCGRGEKPAIFYAIENRQPQMLEWLLDGGASIEQADEYGTTPLALAVEVADEKAVDILIRRGADVNRRPGGFGYLNCALDAKVIRRLLDAGADPSELSSEGRRALSGLE